MQGFMLQGEPELTRRTPSEFRQCMRSGSNMFYGFDRIQCRPVPFVIFSIALSFFRRNLDLQIATWSESDEKYQAFQALCHAEGVRFEAGVGGRGYGVITIYSAVQLNAILARINAVEPLPEGIVRRLKLASGLYPELDVGSREDVVPFPLENNIWLKIDGYRLNPDDFRANIHQAVNEYGYMRDYVGPSPFAINLISFFKTNTQGLTLNIYSWSTSYDKSRAIKAICRDFNMSVISLHSPDMLTRIRAEILITSAAQLDAIFARIIAVEPLPEELICDLKVASGLYLAVSPMRSIIEAEAAKNAKAMKNAAQP